MPKSARKKTPKRKPPKPKRPNRAKPKSEPAPKSTEVSGLEHFGLDLKKIAKEFGKKFATGSSVTKTASGGEEITVQGDVSEDIEEWILDNHDIPEDNVELIEDKKKKGAG